MFLIVILEHFALQKLVCLVTTNKEAVPVSPKMQFIHQLASGWLQITMLRMQNNLLPSVTKHPSFDVTDQPNITDN